MLLQMIAFAWRHPLCITCFSSCFLVSRPLHFTGPVFSDDPDPFLRFRIPLIFGKRFFSRPFLIKIIQELFYPSEFIQCALSKLSILAVFSILWVLLFINANLPHIPSGYNIKGRRDLQGFTEIMPDRTWICVFSYALFLSTCYAQLLFSFKHFINEYKSVINYNSPFYPLLFILCILFKAQKDLIHKIIHSQFRIYPHLYTMINI